MSEPLHPIVQEEISLLAEIRTKLEERPAESGASEKQIVAELLRLREDMPNAKQEDLGALFQQFDSLHALLKQIRSARNNDSVDPDNPYFAHMRLRENGKERDLYLGKVTRIDHGLRIIDWRNAPIARIFYRYREGDDYAEEVGDRILEGDIVARRSVAIAMGELERVDSPQGTFSKSRSGEWTHREPGHAQLAGGQGSSLLKHEKGGAKGRMGNANRQHRSDKYLPDIAALIDPEQFELITRPDSGLVVIRGIAGSGKTTVALHRVAYLAFKEKKHFRPDRMIVVVWGRALRDYISKVLPGLGVEGVKVETWNNWSRNLARKHFPFLPNKIADDTPEIVSRLKLHPGFMAVMEHQIETVPNPATADGVFEDFLGMFMDLEKLEEILAHNCPGVFSRKELERVWDWTRRQRSALTDWVEGDKEQGAWLDPEDDALLLRLWQMRVGPLRARGRHALQYAHMVVDEVQDLSPLEVAVLIGTLDKRRSITLSGDTQQHIIEQAGFTDWESFLERLGVAGSSEVSTLRVSYRSTHEITSFARKVLGDLAEDDIPPTTTRPGAPVELFRFTDHGACVAFLSEALSELVRREPLASIAVLTPSRALSHIYAEGLDKGEVPRLRQVHDQKFAFAPGVEVVEVSEIKGLEFDYVVLVEVSAANYPDNSHARRLMHVGATRAAHQLWLTSVGTPSPILRED